MTCLFVINFYEVSCNHIRYNKHIVYKVRRCIKQILKNCSKFSRDKKLNQINIYNLLNLDKVFTEIIQPKIAMKAFKKLVGEKFICTYFAAQCSLPGARGQNMHLDYPYVTYNEPGDHIPYGMGGKKFFLSCLLWYFTTYYKRIFDEKVVFIFFWKCEKKNVFQI